MERTDSLRKRAGKDASTLKTTMTTPSSHENLAGKDLPFCDSTAEVKTLPSSRPTYLTPCTRNTSPIWSSAVSAFNNSTSSIGLPSMSAEHDLKPSMSTVSAPSASAGRAHAPEEQHFGELTLPRAGDLSHPAHGCTLSGASCIRRVNGRGSSSGSSGTTLTETNASDSPVSVLGVISRRTGSGRAKCPGTAHKASSDGGSSSSSSGGLRSADSSPTSSNPSLKTHRTGHPEQHEPFSRAAQILSRGGLEAGVRAHSARQLLAPRVLSAVQVLGPKVHSARQLLLGSRAAAVSSWGPLGGAASGPLLDGVEGVDGVYVICGIPPHKDKME